MRQRLLDDFPRFTIQHRNRLLACVQIAAYNPHLGLLRPERCEGGHRTVYAGRREADVLMTSFWNFVREFSSFQAPLGGYGGAARRPDRAPLVLLRWPVPIEKSIRARSCLRVE